MIKIETKLSLFPPKGSKGTLFIDLDGTVLHLSTGDPLSGAVEKINAAFDSGYMIVLTTLRGEGYANESRLSCPMTIILLERIGLKYHHIIWNCPSPRTVINDEGAFAINHKKDGDWNGYDF